MSDGSTSEISEYEDVEGDEERDEGLGNEYGNGIRFLYRDEAWIQKFCTFDPPPIEFLGRKGNTNSYEYFPTLLALWNLFWPQTILQNILRETNRYATLVWMLS